MSSESSPFASLLPRSKGGLNGSLTPARRRQPRASQNGVSDDAAGTYPATPRAGASPPRRSRSSLGDLTDYLSDKNSSKGNVSVVRTSLDGPMTVAAAANGLGGYCLTDTEARINELERTEFDLKLRLYYMEERLEEAAGGTSTSFLHKEIADAKRVGDACKSSSVMHTYSSHAGRMLAIGYPDRRIQRGSDDGPDCTGHIAGTAGCRLVWALHDVR